jgi:aminopeptidase N
MNSVRRLSKQFRPENYQLSLTPNIDTESFTGEVTITGKKIGVSSNKFTFHQLGLIITDAQILFNNKGIDETITISRINNQNSFDEVRLHAKSKIKSGKYTINLKFKGKITKKLSGMYISTYKIKNKDHNLIVTQFESHHAREVFPCIDEPDAKATFDLTLTTDVNQNAISNTPVLTQIKTDDKYTTTFKTTPLMSTYLLAFIIGDLAYKESMTKNHTLVRAYATKDNINYLDFALNTAIKCLDFYNEYFDIPYPLEKCDLIAIPDFSSGAMENWGCITFREQAMLVDPARTSLANKQYIALVVAHELAHQWFGNLVTMRWWNDLWLNEGFASWMEFFAINYIYPDWDLWTQFVVDEQQLALSLDSLENTHPVEVPIKHPDEIRTIFDTISYSKGASIIHMLHQYVGPEKFKLGLRDYLTSYSYKNTSTKDLWKSLEKIANKPVTDFVSAWTSSPGYPVLKVDIENNTLEINQKRFSYTKNEINSESWPIALLSNNKYLPEIFNKKHLKFKGDFSDLKLNNGQTGFYRVAYDSNHLASLGIIIKDQRMDVVDRLGLLSDLFETSKIGISHTVDTLNFLDNYRQEDNYAVWDVIAGIISNIKAVMDDESLRSSIKPFIAEIINLEFNRLGLIPIEHESHFDKLLRPTILALGASADVKEIIDFCKKQFNLINTHNYSSSVINPDFKGFIYSTIARIGDKKDYDKLVNLHDSSSLSEERTTLAVAITSFSQPEIIKLNLEKIKSSSVRIQDVSYWIAYSFANRFARKMIWEWVKQNWGWLEENLGTDLSFFRMPIYAARSFSDIEFENDYKAFFEPLLNPSFERSYKQGLEIIDMQRRWRTRSLSDVKKYFKIT